MGNDSFMVYLTLFLASTLFIWIFACSIVGGSYILCCLLNAPLWLSLVISIGAFMAVVILLVSLGEGEGL